MTCIDYCLRLLGNAAPRLAGSPSGLLLSIDVYKTLPKPATGLICIGFLNNCECPRCHNESRETTHGKPIPDTGGVTDMDSMGRKHLMKDSKKRKWGSQPPSRVL